MTVFTYSCTYAVGKRETAATTQNTGVLETTELTLFETERVLKKELRIRWVAKRLADMQRNRA